MNALTADLMATAIIAAARSYGDDPVDAVTRPKHKRSLTPALYGLKEAGGFDITRTSLILGISANGARVLKSRGGAAFEQALAAATAAVAAALPPPAAPTCEPAPVTDSTPSPAPRAALRPPPGRIASSILPLLAPRSAPPEPAGTLRGRILGVLRDGSATPMGLATLLDAKELLVTQALANMEHEGLVAAGDVPAEGRRQQRWRLAAPVSA